MNDSFDQARRHFLDGVAHLDGGRPDQAEPCFEAALALLPGRVSTLVNLAATRVHLDRPDAALPLLDEALAAAPDDADAWYQRAQALTALQRPADALAALERLLALAPAHAMAWLRHGQMSQALDREAAALGSYERALALDPTLALAWTNRGNILREQGRASEAAEAFRHALAHGADPTLVGYYLAGTGEQAAPPAAPRPYVEQLFDDYAPSFDAHLAALEYRAPGAIAQMLRDVGPARFVSALDLGCGTGQCGPLLGPMADRLEGVDLSAAMLERARALGVYHALEHAEAVEHLQRTARRHDLVVAADMLIYLGALDPLFAGVARALSPGGLFCFSVEAARDAVDFELRASLRYAHSPRYLRACAARAGLRVERLHAAPIRAEQQRPIEGLYACLRKP